MWRMRFSSLRREFTARKLTKGPAQPACFPQKHDGYRTIGPDHRPRPARVAAARRPALRTESGGASRLARFTPRLTRVGYQHRRRMIKSFRPNDPRTRIAMK